MKVVIADDQLLFRDSLKALLEANDIEVIGEAGSGREAVHLTEKLRPDIVLMDLEMPDVSGIEATEQIHRNWPETCVVVLTGSEKDTDLFKAFKVGAQGYLLKNMPARRVVPLLKRVSEGEPALSPEVARKLLAELTTDRRSDPDPLTERELEVLGLMVSGTTSNRKLARKMNVSENTVKFHVRNILDKLHLHSRAEAVGHALRNRLVDPVPDLH